MSVNDTVTKHTYDYLKEIFDDIREKAKQFSKKKNPPEESVYELAKALFRAVTKKTRYVDDNYGSIDDMTESSPVLEDVDDRLLSGSIAMILKRGLTGTQKSAGTNIAPYAEIDELLSDLDKTEAMAERLFCSDTSNDKSPWKGKVGKFQLDRTSLMIINALYQMPIINAESRQINVLVAGNNEYTRIFTDYCLQLCQVADHSLHIVSVSDDCHKCSADYLNENMPANGTVSAPRKKRSALKSFVNIKCDQITDPNVGYMDDAYADMDFVSIEPAYKLEAAMTEEAAADNKNKFENMLSNIFDGSFTYAFVSMDSDLESIVTARAVLAACPGIKLICVTENNMVSVPGMLNAAVEDNVSISEIDPMLVKMAFNAHCIWSGNDNRKNLFKAYMKKSTENDYNRLSSIFFAVSVQYKLLALGIDPKGAVSAAGQFQKMCRESPKERVGGTPALVRKMAAYEHRRWVMEKITSGWTRLKEEDYSACLANCCDKDRAGLRHPCIVKSEETAPLSSPSMTHQSWESCGIENYDELDRASLKMHREAKKLMDADDLKNNFTQLNCFTELKNIFENLTAASAAPDSGNANSAHYNVCRAPKYVFNKFHFCIQHILNGSSEYAIRFNEICKELIACKTNATAEQFTRIAQCVNEIKKKLYPAIFFCRYYDYKKVDIELIENIPYILTFPVTLNTIMAFEDGRNGGNSNDAIFANAASALVLRPTKLTYLYDYDCRSNPDKFKHRLLNVVNFFISKNYFPVIDVLMLDNLPKGERPPFRSGDALLPEYIDNHHIDKQPNENADMSCTLTVCSSLKEFKENVWFHRAEYIYDGSTMLFSSSIENCKWISDITSNFKYFEYISDSNSFVNTLGSEFLEYVQNKSYLKAENMLALNNAYLLHQGESTLPDYYDIYNILANICIYGNREGRTESGFNYSCNTFVQNWNNILTAVSEHQNDRRRDPDFDKMKVTNCPIRNEQYEAAKNLIAVLKGDPNDANNIAFVKNDQYDDEKKRISFEFASDRARRIMEKSGEILEVYCYYKALETGYFDDVISGYEFQWFEGNVTNESDLILTKGNKTMIVECKMTRELKQDYIPKLDSLGNNFGINCRKVLVSYAYWDSFNSVRMKNNIQRSRGAQLNINVVSDINDILNIGQTFIKIMEDRYRR